jgi:hypothetical protein
LLLAAVANSSGLVMIYEDPAFVYVGAIDDFESLDQLSAPLVGDDFREATVAVVAATPGQRLACAPLLEDGVYSVFTTGGAPASMGLVLGRLETLVVTKPQTMHDAAYLPILAALQVFIRTGDQMLGIEEVRELMSVVARSKADRRAHPIPAFIASRKFVVAHAIAHAIGS